MFLVYVVAINKGSMRSILKQMITSKVSINNTVNLQIPIFISKQKYQWLQCSCNWSMALQRETPIQFAASSLKYLVIIWVEITIEIWYKYTISSARFKLVHLPEQQNVIQFHIIQLYRHLHTDIYRTSDKVCREKFCKPHFQI